MKTHRSHSSINTPPGMTARRAWVPVMAAALALMTACRLFRGANTIPDLSSPRATPVAESPAAGICGTFDGDIVTLTIYPDIPDPRCVEVTSEQKLRVVNRRGERIQAAIGKFKADLAPDEEHTFDVPVGEYLMPGVHLLQVSPCCSPEVVLKASYP
jgi:hypothetical protein